MVLPCDPLIIRWTESWQSLDSSYDHQMSCVVICLFPLAGIPSGLAISVLYPDTSSYIPNYSSSSSLAALFLLFDHHLALFSPSDTSSSPPLPPTPPATTRHTSKCSR